MANHSPQVLIDDAHWKTDLLQGLLQMQQNGDLCDVVIESGDQVVLSAHACVLSTSSAVLSQLLRQSQSLNERPIRLRSEISGDVWRRLVTYMYTGELSLPSGRQHLRDVMLAAKSLSLDNLVRACRESKQLAETRDVPGHVTALFRNIESIVGRLDDGGDPSGITSDMYQQQESVDATLPEDVHSVDDSSGTASPATPVPMKRLLQNKQPRSDQWLVRDQSANAATDNTRNTMLGSEFGEIRSRNTSTPVQSKASVQAVAGMSRRKITKKLIRDIGAHKKDNVENVERKTEGTGNFHEIGLSDQIPAEIREVVPSLLIGGESIPQQQASQSFILDSTSLPEETLLATSQISSAEMCNVDFALVSGGIGDAGPAVQEESSTSAPVATDGGQQSAVENAALEYYECEYCKKSYRSLYYLKRHIAFVHPSSKDAVTCPVCAKAFLTSYHLKRHMALTCKERLRYPCPHCGKQLKSKAFLANHIALHTGNKPYKCDLCESSFPTKSRLKIHAAVHETGEYPCHCGKVFNNEKNYKSHFKYAHSVVSPYRCNICHKNGRSAKWLQKHLVCHTKKYLCQVCKKGFDTKRSRDTHENLHMLRRSKSYECPTCQKAFKTRPNLARHLGTAHGETYEYRCDKCSKSFETELALNEHVTSHNKPKKLVCRRCNAEVYGAEQLSEHLMSAHGITENSLPPKVFMCVICKQFVRDEGELNAHESAHTTPASCMFCRYRFGTVAELRTHLCSKLRCVYCEVNFKTPKLLEKHVEMHSQSKIFFKCEHCPNFFVTLSAKKNHIARAHRV